MNFEILVYFIHSCLLKVKSMTSQTPLRIIVKKTLQTLKYPQGYSWVCNTGEKHKSRYSRGNHQGRADSLCRRQSQLTGLTRFR